MNIIMRKTIEQLQKQTAQYAIEHITGKGMHTGIAWFSDSFNELCEAMGANEFDSEDIGFELDDLVEKCTTEDIDRIVNDFICEYWLTRPEEVTTKDVADVLKVADPLSKRHLIGQKVAIDCIHALNQEQLHRLDEILRDLEKNPDLGRAKGIKR